MLWGVKNFKNCKVTPPTIKHKRVYGYQYKFLSGIKKFIQERDGNSDFKNAKNIIQKFRFSFSCSFKTSLFLLTNEMCTIF